MTQRVTAIDFEGHMIFPGAETLSGSAKGVLNFALTLSRSIMGGTGSSTHYRTGLILPRPGSTTASVRNVIRAFAISQIGGHPNEFVTLFYDLEPNVIFGANGDYAGAPDEVTEEKLAEGVTAYEEWERAEAAKKR